MSCAKGLFSLVKSRLFKHAAHHFMFRRRHASHAKRTCEWRNRERDGNVHVLIDFISFSSKKHYFFKSKCKKYYFLNKKNVVYLWYHTSVGTKPLLWRTSVRREGASRPTHDELFKIYEPRDERDYFLFCEQVKIFTRYPQRGAWRGRW